MNDAWEGCVGGLLTSSLCYEILLFVLVVWALMAARTITSARGHRQKKKKTCDVQAIFNNPYQNFGWINILECIKYAVSFLDILSRDETLIWLAHIA